MRAASHKKYTVSYVCSYKDMGRMQTEATVHIIEAASAELLCLFLPQKDIKADSG